MSVVIETTLGDITVDLYLEQRPVTCLNFLKLCKMKYYNFNLFHSIRSGFIAQTGDPTAEGSGGESIFGCLEGPEKRFFSGEKLPKIRHTNTGTLSMVCTGDMMVGSQFFFTLAPDLDSLDGVHCVIGEVTEGHDVLRKLNDVICDEGHRPYRDVRITHTVVLEDPFNDPPGFRAPSRSPSPSAERLKGGRIAPDEDIDEAQGKSAEEVQELIEEKEAKARATILEIVGDLPDADIAPPENVLFVCKLNPVTTDEDLEIIFSRFGKIVGCEVIRDKKTGDSLQYAFVEFADKKSCEDAYFKMDNVLIDDRRIHVDFSQSVSRMRWFGKGRGIKYFNENDPKDKSLSNHTFNRNNQNGDDHKNGKIDDSKSRHRSKDRDHNKHDRSSRHKSDRDKSRRDRSRSKSRKDRSSHKSRRHKSRSLSRDRRRRRSRSKSGERSRRISSRSRDRSRRDSHQRRSGHKSNRDRSRSRHRSRRDRSRSRHRSRKERSRSRHRRERSKSRHDRSKRSTRTYSHERDKERSRTETKEIPTTNQRDKSKSISKEIQPNLEHLEEKIEQSDKINNSTIKSRSVSPKNEEEIKIIQKYFKKSRWVEVTETQNEEHVKESGIDSCENNDDESFIAADKHESTLNENDSINNDNVNVVTITNHNDIQNEVIEVNEKEKITEPLETKEPTEIDEEDKQPQEDNVNKKLVEKETKLVEKETRTPTPVIKTKDIKNKINSKKDKKKKVVKVKSKKKRKYSTSESSSESSSSSETSSSSDDDKKSKKKKKTVKKRKKRVSTSSSSSSSESSSTSSSDYSSSSESEPVKKKRKKKTSSKVVKSKKTKKKS